MMVGERNVCFGAARGDVLFFQWIDGSEMFDPRILYFK
jgi:hypothetical protein